MSTKGVAERNRCGHCGRTFTDAQWRRNRLWCPRCRKLMCRECVGTGMLCPACATKTGFDYYGLFFVTFLTGITFIFIGTISILQSTIPVWETPEYPLVMLGLPGMMLAIAALSLYKIIERKRSHRRHVSGMPAGIIPPELRPGYNDPEVRRMWGEANIDHSMRGGILKDPFVDSKFKGLEGRWDFPVISKEERIEWNEKSTRGMKKSIPIFVLIGILMTIGNYIFYKNIALYLLAIIPILIGLLALSLVWGTKKLVAGDGEFEVNAYWKKVGHEATCQSIAAFLERRGDRYERTSHKMPKGLLWNNPEHRFTFDNGVYIKSLYEEKGDGHVYGWLTITYRQSQYEFAQKLQQDLDDFLLANDLIERQLVF